MNAIISKGDKTAHVQLPLERKQLAGALSYLGANHTSDYDLKYNEENKDGLKVSLECLYRRKGKRILHSFSRQRRCPDCRLLSLQETCLSLQYCRQ